MIVVVLLVIQNRRELPQASGIGQAERLSRNLYEHFSHSTVRLRTKARQPAHLLARWLRLRFLALVFRVFD